MKNSRLKRIKPYLLLTPVLTLLAGVFLSGIMLGFVQSLGYFPVIGLKELTFRYYLETFREPTFIRSLTYSLSTAFFQALVSVVLGLLFGYNLVASKGRLSKVGHWLYKLPIMIPHTVVVLMIVFQFAESGFFSRLLLAAGWTDQMSDFPNMIYDEFGIGIVMAYIYKGLPFSVLIAYESIRNSYDQYAKMARSLGASPVQVFRHVVLPLVFPSLLSAFIILFVFALGAYEIPYLLGSSSPRALPVEAFVLYKNIDLGMRPYSMVINMVITFMAILLLTLYHIVQKTVIKIIKGGNSND